MKVPRLLIAVVLTALAAPAWADSVTYDVDLSGLGYGHINQNTPGITNGGSACGPTSTINSFIYLQTHFGINGLGASDGAGGYQNIGRDTSASAIAAVNAMGTAMGLTAGGVTDANFINGKKNYLQQRGLLNSVLTVEYQSVNVGGTVPTWQFLYEQLKKGQDVEVGFTWGAGGGHWVTATGFNFVDGNGNNTIDAGETARMTFVDPWGGNYITGTLGMSGNNMQVTYSGGAAGNGSTGTIDIVVAESPIPLPAAVWLGAALLGGLAASRSKLRLVVR